MTVKEGRNTKIEGENVENTDLKFSNHPREETPQ